MKKISVLILTCALFFSSINISFAFEQKTNSDEIFSGISNVFKVQYELYQKTKYHVINVCDIVVKDVLSLKAQNNHEMSFIDLQKQFTEAETALLPPNTVVLSAKFLPVNYKTTKVPLTAAFLLLFICLFLLRYLGLLRVFWSAVYISKYFKKAYFLYMLSFIFGKKTISLITVTCFLFSVLAADLSAAVLNDKMPAVAEAEQLFSKDFGKITEAVNNKSDLFVVNIQDLHSNPSVQLNIKNILTSIDKQYQVKQVFIEGGYGDVDISWLYKIPDLKDRNNLADSLLKNGRLTGSEYFAYKTGLNTVLKGLEDEQIHKNNLKALSAIMDRQGFYNARLQKIKADIDFINASQASNKNLRLNKIVARHNNGVIDTAKFYKLLLKAAKEINKNPKDYKNIMPVDLSDFTNINKYINVNLAKINRKKLSDEINLFLSDIKSRMTYAEYSEIVKNTDGFSDVSKFVRHVQSLSGVYKIDLAKKYPVLYVYSNVSILSESINPLELINEERVLLNNLRQAFSKNNTEYEVSFLADFYDIFKKYMTNSLTANEYEYFSAKMGKFKEIYSKYAVVDRLSDLKTDFDMLDAYYSVNNFRNGIFINNVLAGREIKYENTDADKNIFDGAKDVIVIIAGGYHTKGIGQLLKDRKISYITITPNVKSPIDQSEKIYKEIIKEETSVETNALSFTVASCASDYMQFKWGVVSAIQYLNKEYSKENIEKTVESMKYLVKDKITLNYTEEKTEITVGDRKIVLLNYNGQMRSSEDIDENKFQPTANNINSFGINALFEKYPSLDLSNGGLEFKLRHLEKFGITEIKGIDLAVIARLPSLFQEYLFETLSAEVKAKSEELVTRETIRKYDKTPELLEELEEMLIERIKTTPDSLQLLHEILPMHLQILKDRAGDTQLFINPLKKDLKDLLKGSINKSQYTYVTAILFFISEITGNFSDAVNITDPKCDRELLEDFMAAGAVTVSSVEKYAEFPGILLKRGYKMISSFSKGGSSAKVFLAQSPEGKTVVVKYTDWDGISGNGTPWTVSQIKKLEEIHNSFPAEASKYYPKVIDSYHEGKVAFYAMEYFEGAQDITQYFFEDKVTKQEMEEWINSILSVLVKTHYGKDKLVEIDDEIKINHYNRAKYRLSLLPRHDGEIYKRLVEGNGFKLGKLEYADPSYFFEDMMNRKYIIINGRPYPNLTELMNVFAKNIVALQQELGPTHYSKYVHGDLPLRNIFIMPDKELKIADVRGQNVDPTSPDKTSVEFDIAKIVHSFFLELIRGKYYTLSASREGSNFNFDFNYQSENPSVNKYLEVWKNIYSVLKNNPDLQALFANAKGNWLEHIKLAECSNYASDAIHRFSQDPTGQDAIAYYLNAVMMFYELLKSHDMIDDNWNVLINEKFKNENKDTTTGDEEILKNILTELKRRKGQVIAINGPTAAGKSTFSANLQKYLIEQGYEIQVLPADWFLTERKTRNEYAKRVKAGQSHIGDYYQWSYEIPRFLDLLKQVRNLLNAGINKIINVPNTYLRKDGSKNGNEKLTLSDKTIVIVEGVGVVNKETKDYFDLSVFCDVDNNQTIMNRLNQREEKKPQEQRLTPEFVKERFDVIDYHMTSLYRLENIEYHDFVFESNPSGAVLYRINKQDDTEETVREEKILEKLVDAALEKYKEDGIDREIILNIMSEHLRRLKQRETIDLNNEKWQGRLYIAVEGYIKHMGQVYDYVIGNVFGRGDFMRQIRIDESADEFIRIVDNEVKKGIHFFVYSGGSGVGKGAIWKSITKRYPDKFKKYLIYTTRARRPDSNYQKDIHRDANPVLFSALEFILADSTVDLSNFESKLKGKTDISSDILEELKYILDLSGFGKNGERFGINPLLPRNKDITIEERIRKIDDGTIRIFGEFDGVDYYFLDDVIPEKSDNKGDIVEARKERIKLLEKMRDDGELWNDNYVKDDYYGGPKKLLEEAMADENSVTIYESSAPTAEKIKNNDELKNKVRFVYISPFYEPIAEIALMKFGNIVKNMFAKGISPVIVSDLDLTLTYRDMQDNYATLDGVAKAIADILRNGGKFIVLTGNKKDRVDTRVLEGVKKELGENDKYLQNFYIFPRYASEVWTYDENKHDFVKKVLLNFQIKDRDSFIDELKNLITEFNEKHSEFQLGKELTMEDQLIVEDAVITLKGLGRSKPFRKSIDPEGVLGTEFSDKVLKYLESRSGEFDVIYSDKKDATIDILPKGLNKGRAIGIIAKHMKIDKDSIIYFGDQFNKNGNDFPVLGKVKTVVNVGSDVGYQDSSVLVSAEQHAFGAANFLKIFADKLIQYRAGPILKLIAKLFENELINKGPSASILGREYKDTAHKWEWIYNLPFSSFISSFIKKHAIKSIADKEIFEQSISLGKKPALTILFDSISSITGIAGITFGILTGTLPVAAVSVLIYSLSRGIIFSTAHGNVTAQKEKIKLAGLGTGFALIAAIPVIIGLSVFPVITPFLLVIGQLLSAQIHKLYNSGLLKAYINGAKIKASHIIAAVLIIATLAAGTIVVNNYFTQTYTEYAQIQQEIINIQSDRFEIIFSGYLKNTHLTAQEKAEINTLRDFFASNIDRSSNDKFLESLLYIRTEITSTDSVLTPSIDAGFSLYVWKDVVQDLDEMISDNLAEIQKDKNLNEILSRAYSADEISYLEILSLRDDSEALTKIINGQKDMHYRFYAFMLLNAKDHISADAFFNKDDILNYLDGEYILRDPLSLADINNSFQWQAMCAMMNFITGSGEDYSSILHDARVVRPGGPQISNAGLAYVISGDGTVSPIFVAAHEVAHIRFLNILGIHKNTDGYKISELYAELEAAQIEEKVSVMMQYTGDKKITDLTDDTDDYTVAYVVIEEVRDKVGLDSLNLLQDAIIEFLQARGEKPAENIQKTMKEVVEIFAAKVADSQIVSGVISESQRQNKIKEITDSLISAQIQNETSVSLPTAAPSQKPAAAAMFPYGFIGMFFAGIKGGKNKPVKYKHFNYIVSEFEKEGAFFERFKKVVFRESENGFDASYKHGLFGKTETVFLSNDISKEEAYTLIKGLIAEYLPTDLQGNLHYYTQFFKRDIRGTVYVPLFKYDSNGQYGFVINILKDKISKGDRTFRFWSCGSATGEELRTFAWFVRKTLIDLGENPNDWKLDFYGTDNNKTTAEIASSFNGADVVENKEVKVDMSGFNVRYVILDHTNMTDLKNWLIWQKEEGGFDLICQLNNPTPQQEQEAVTKEVMHPYSIYIHHNQMYDVSASQIKIEKSFSDAITVNEFFGAMPEVKTKSKTDANYAFIGLLGFFKDLIDAVFSKDGNRQKTAVIYEKIFAYNIFYNNSKPEISDGVVFAPVFVIEGPLTGNSSKKLNLKPAGIKINDEPLYYAVVENVLYLYAEGCGYNDIVASVQKSAFIRKQVSICLNRMYGRRIKSENLDIKEIKILKGGSQSLKYNNAGIVEITLNNFDPSKIKDLAVSYIDSAARYGFAVRESIFRYIDDFNVSADKKDRINNFISIIESQKNVSCQLILDYEVYRQLVSDIGLEKFNEILSQAKSKNVSVYVFVSSESQITDISGNSSLFGFVENTDGKYFITDIFTKDSSEAAFASDCDSVQKIILFMEANISKQPVIFKNSLIKKAVDSEQDTVLTGILRDIFSAGRLINTISAAKSKYSAGKIARTFSVKELSESFDDNTFDRIKKLYGTYINLSDGEQLKAKLYAEITALLGMNNTELKRFFDINALSDKTDSGGTVSVFIDMIIFRIAAAKQLALEGKTTGLKNREYEDILAKALKIMMFDIGNDTGDDMDAEVIRLAGVPNSYEKEKNLADYLKNNMRTLTQRAFSNTEPDARAVNTLIFLIPFAEANDVEIDITKLAVDQNDIIIKAKAVLSAA